MTNPLRLIVVDDEPLAVERLVMILGTFDTVEVIGTASDGLAAVETAERMRPDLCLLDIDMPGLDGVSAAQLLGRLPCPPKVIFVTAFDRFAVQAFDAEAVDYLLKPVARTRLESALQRARQRIAEHGQATPEHKPERTEFWVTEGGGLVRLDVRAVDHVTAERDYVRLHSGRRTWLINESMARLTDTLDPALFVRLHRGAIVRKDFVSGLRRTESGWSALLADGSEQRIGRSFSATVDLLRGRAGQGRKKEGGA